jgi:spore germination protein YaaH
MPKKIISIILSAVTLGAIAMAGSFATTSSASAATKTTTTKTTTVTTVTTKAMPLQIGAWLPYWQGQPGAQDIALHLESFNEISPFSYEINSQGLIMDDLQIGSGKWDAYFGALHDANVKIIPTIAYFDADGIYTLLSSSTTRQAAEDTIAQLVQGRGFDGIDIDFEGMSPATRPYYSLFIQGLAIRLHPQGESLTCTVVPRTPLDSLYANPPTNVVYPENYTVLNKYCDEVRLMTYDQEGVDIKLDATKGSDGTLYAPVADPDWVKKLVVYALQYISPKKIMLGVPTYGYEYEVSWANGETTYQRVRAFDYFDAMARATSTGAVVTRNNADELTFTFASTTYIQEPAILTFTEPSAQPEVLMHPNPNATTTFFVSFPDAQSEMDKVALANKYGLRGVMFFKADGQMDPALWSLLP